MSQSLGISYLTDLKPKRSSDPVVVVSKGLALPMSQEGVEFIQTKETGGRAYYTKRYTGLIWPGGASGATAGVGFDCGYNSRSQITYAWSETASSSEMNALLACSGAKGYRGKALARRYSSSVNFTWEEAQRPFVKDTLPRFTKITKKAFRLKPDQLHPHSNSALVSLVFNRGGSMGTPGRSSWHSRRHMRKIRDLLASGNYDRVDNVLIDMQNIWRGKGLNGLLLRRREEADMFAVGEIARKKWGVPPI